MLRNIIILDCDLNWVGVLHSSSDAENAASLPIYGRPRIFATFGAVNEHLQGPMSGARSRCPRQSKDVRAIDVLGASDQLVSLDGGVCKIALKFAVVHGGGRVPDEVAFGDGNHGDVAVEHLTGVYEVADALVSPSCSRIAYGIQHAFQVPSGLDVAAREVVGGVVFGMGHLAHVGCQDGLLGEVVLPTGVEHAAPNPRMDPVCVSVGVLDVEIDALAVVMKDLSCGLECVEAVLMGSV